MARSSDLGPLPLNWRDVGLSLAMIQDNFVPPLDSKLLSRRDAAFVSENELPGGTPGAPPRAAAYPRAGRLLRCGQLCPHHDRETVGAPRTIINLRHSDDAASSYHHSLTSSGAAKSATTTTEGTENRVALHRASAENSLEKYDASDREVSRWIASALRLMQDATPPILVHCRSGRDRTGAVVCAALLAVGVRPERIRREYSLSSDADEKYIELTLRGLQGKGGVISCKSSPWLRGVDANLLRSKLVGDSDSVAITHQSRDGQHFEGSELSHPSLATDRSLCQAVDIQDQEELAFLRKHLQALQAVAQPLLGERCGRGNDLTSQERSLLDGMMYANCRQIRLLESMKEDSGGYQNHGSGRRSMGGKGEGSISSQRIARAWAKQGFLRKLIGEYVHAAGCFERAAEESGLVVDYDESIFVQRKKWERQRLLCSKLAKSAES